MAGSLSELDQTGLPPEHGSYALWLLLDEPARISVGRFGRLDFAAGSYVYLGSAFGPGGLRARIRHHLAGCGGRAHWHIDYLRKAAKVMCGWYSTAPVRLECAWSQALERMPGAAIPVPGFGSSDCKNGCQAHLIAMPDGYSLQLVGDVLAKTALAVGGGSHRFRKIDYNGSTLSVEDCF